MDESLTADNIEINTTHGNDIGIGVCEGAGVSISPCLLMQAVCPDPYPFPISVEWDKASPPPKVFRKSNAAPILYGEGGRVLSCTSYLHLLSVQANATHAFEQETSLQDWRFPVRIAGIVVIFDQKYDNSMSMSLWNQVQGLFKSTTSKNRTLDWVKAQQLPFVVAAAGYGSERDSINEFRRYYELAANVPIIPVPVFADPKRLQARRRGASAEMTQDFSQLMFGNRAVSFDKDYAKQVLSTLCRLIEK